MEQQIARSLMTATLMEEALHGQGSWLMWWGETSAEVDRIITDDEIVLRAFFEPRVCHLDTRPHQVILTVDDEVRGVREIGDPGDGPFQVMWRLRCRLVPIAA